MERQGSVRRSDTIEENEDVEDLHTNSSNQNLNQPSKDFLCEAYSQEEEEKYDEDEDIQQLESHLNNSIRQAVRVEVLLVN